MFVSTLFTISLAIISTSSLVEGQRGSKVCFCGQVFDPVCGVDGKQYGNECEAGCENVVSVSFKCQYP